MQIPSQYIISTADESKALDAKTSQEFGIDTFTLMEVAGYSAASIIEKKVKPDSEGLFLCGKGNNGGDALVAARYLAQKGIKTTIIFAAGDTELSQLAQKNYQLLKKIERHDERLKIQIIDNWSIFDTSLKPDFIVDGMLGIGLNSALRGDILEAVRWANNQSSICFSMDIPTGLHADSGQIMGAAIQADFTCSFGSLKQGFYLNEGLDYRGEVIFCDLPFPDYLKKDSSFLIDGSYLTPLEKKPAAHKYAAGVVYIIGGSEGLTGAAIMAAKSAWSAGVGAVILLCPHGLLPIFENNLPAIIKKPIGESKDTFFKKEHINETLSFTKEKKGTVLIGPGLGRDKSTGQFTNQYLKNTESDCVIDADALWALAQHDGWQNQHSSYILTPHPGELKTLLKEEISDDKKRLDCVRKTAVEKNITILSKGFPVMIGNKNAEMFISGYDSRNFSRAGFGDVLAGKVAAFKALGDTDEEACMRALLSGENKMRRLLNKNQGYAAEPKDII